MKKQTPESFWAKVDIRSKDECWEWQGALAHNGYGKTVWCMQRISAHRLAAWLSGIIFELVAKDNKQHVMHSCDNKKCCNPRHLSHGSAQQNIRDSRSRKLNVSKQGEESPSAKLSNEHVLAIRGLWFRGEHTQQQLADMYGVTQVTVWRYIHNKRYRNVRT